jgi:2-polyprenyl-3-methyl-5-hydroxy-6-metoxy-1,4-benzoquinol methylase
LADIQRFLPRGEGLSFLEIGCAPGGILGHICGALGYEAHGLDFACEPSDIEALLRRHKVNVGEIHKADFLAWRPERRFDIVASFGFIEHFSDPLGLARRHFELAAPGGTVVLGVPNFAHGQRVLHYVFDRAQLARHNTTCMSLDFMRRVAHENNAELRFAEYVGGHFAFWPGHDPRRRITELVMRQSVRALHGIGRRLPGRTNRWFSPYIVAVFKTRGNEGTP